VTGEKGAEPNAGGKKGVTKKSNSSKTMRRIKKKRRDLILGLE